MFGPLTKKVDSQVKRIVLLLLGPCALLLSGCDDYCGSDCDVYQYSGGQLTGIYRQGSVNFEPARTDPGNTPMADGGFVATPEYIDAHNAAIRGSGSGARCAASAIPMEKRDPDAVRVCPQ